MTPRFGTDGVRGDARTVVTPVVVRALARAGAELLGADRFAVGRDPRRSGPGLAAAVHAGVADAGGTSVELGVVPTPAVAHWCREHSVAGAMISASHNPWYDNGVKFFAPGGRKLGDEVQSAIQARFDDILPTLDGSAPRPSAPAPLDRHAAATSAHVAMVVGSVGPGALAGLTVVVDPANGAASESAPVALRELGADVVVLHAEPDGTNINDGCGSTAPESLMAAVVAHGADAGLAFDGDADRVLAVDHRGRLVDGDHIIAICALDAAARRVLTDDTVVVTVMANLGFRRAMEAVGITVVETPVGDRHVLEALDAGGYSLGGEQSGHVIFHDLAATGDGLLTGVQLLSVLRRRDDTLASLADAAMTRLPQVLENVRVEARPADLDEALAPFVAASLERMAGRGRVLIRPSGTEPLIRVMVEAETDAEARREADELVAAVLSRFGGD